MENLLVNIDKYVFWEELPTEFTDEVYAKLKSENENLKSLDVPYSVSFYLMATYLQKIEEPKLIQFNLTESELNHFRRNLFAKYNYSSLSKNTLHTYFSWRTTLRRLISDNSLSTEEIHSTIDSIESDQHQVILFFYELFNLIWPKSPLLGYKFFNKFQVIYDDENPIYFFKEYFEAYCFYYGFPHPYGKQFFSEQLINPEIVKMLNNEYVSLSEFFKKTTKYKYGTSAFYSQPNGYLIEELMPYVTQEVYRYLKDTHGFELFTVIAGTYRGSPYNPIGLDPFLHNRFCAIPNHFDLRKRISYALKQDNWIEYEFLYSSYQKAVISYLYKLTDRYLREYFKYNYRIIVNIDRFCEDTSKSEKYLTFRNIIYSQDFNDTIKQKLFNHLKSHGY